MQILVVDDDAIVIKSCTRILQSQGFEVTATANADEVSEMVRSRTFDLMLMDVKMPKRDGLSLIKEIKTEVPGLPIIVMSGYPTQETVDNMIGSGAAQFISKPFRPDELMKVIRQVLHLD